MEGIPVKLYEYDWDNIDEVVAEATNQQCRDGFSSTLYALTQLHRRLKLTSESPETNREKLGQMIHALLTFGLTLSDLFGHYQDFMELSQQVWDAYYGAQEEQAYSWRR